MRITAFSSSTSSALSIWPGEAIISASALAAATRFVRVVERQWLRAPLVAGCVQFAWAVFVMLLLWHARAGHGKARRQDLLPTNRAHAITWGRFEFGAAGAG